MPDDSVVADNAVDAPAIGVDPSDASPMTTSHSDSKSPQPRKKRRRRRKTGSKPRSAPSASQADPSEAPTPRPTHHGGKKPIDAQGAKHLFADQSFADLGLRNSVLKGLDDLGFHSPTHIQAELIPTVLEGRDVLGQAKTGSGKTAAFGLPLFHLAQRSTPFQSLILVPTRELAIQITRELNSFGKHTPIRVVAVYGGEAVRRQQEELAEGPEIIVATPGRLMDLAERGDLHFRNVRFAVLDEVDRMLDIGFRDDIRKILGQVKSKHQTIFVSATISSDIEKLAARFMVDPMRITSVAGALTVEMVDQYHLPVERWDKKRLLVHLLRHEKPDLTLIFCATKRMVDNLARYLNDQGIGTRSIHGDLPQRKRNSVMNQFRSGRLGVMVASDVAARGLDVDGISHVVNYDIPVDPEVYVHRIGRTARAGQRGVAWTFVTSEEGPLLTAVEKLANTEVPKLEYPDFTPGSPPRDVRERRAAQEKIAATPLDTKSRNIAAAPPAVAQVKLDSARFPGGLAPTKMPPRMLGGRVRTSRSMRQAPPPPIEEKKET